MRNVLAIMKRELRAYFDAPVAYIVLVAFLVVAGWMLFSQVFLIDRADVRGLFAPSPFSPSLLLVILAPAVTMRLVAEERKTGTIELLTTLPVTDTQVILGKYLAALGLLTIALLATLAYPITISFLGPLDWGPVLAGYVGLILFAAALLAIGVFCSTLTDNQIVAFIVAFILCAALYFVFWLQILLPQSLGAILEYASVSFHLDNMARGVIDTRDIVYYLSLVIAALFLSVQSLSRRHA
ncbi:MAG: ABC transporter [Deltaproteobacteria bacterium]|nr:ABC transporter [Deltaproteobacteria bacterium]